MIEMLPFARAERKSIAHLWNNKDYCAEVKLDGWRVQIQLGGACDRLYAYTRSGEEIGKNILHLKPNADISNLGLTIIDGELIPVEGEFHSLAGVRAGKINDVTYKIFDCLYLNGVDIRGLPLENRLEIVNAVLNSLYLNHQFVSPVKRVFKDTYKFFVEQVGGGAEGVVLKRLSATYGANDAWIKIKHTPTVDVIISGYEDGYGSKYGVAKISVLDGDKLISLGNVGILDPIARGKIKEDPVKYIGSCIELKCLKLDLVSSKLREPIFCRLREDMSNRDATWSKLQYDLMKINL